MSINVNTGGLWKEAVPFVRPAGSWKEAEAYVRQSGLWYQVTQSGLNLVIDSATPLYDFNLKSWLQNAGLWPSSGPVVINELRISARTVITHQPMTVRVPDFTTDINGTPPDYHGYTKVVVMQAGESRGGVAYAHRIITYDQDLSVHAFTTGSGWPPGSVINSFIVDGRIIGRGGDGSGTLNTPMPFRATTMSTNTLSIHTVSMRHGWPALEVTIPVGFLGIVGEVGGGGGGGCYAGIAATQSSVITATQHAAYASAFAAEPKISTLFLMTFGPSEVYIGSLGAHGRTPSGTNGGLTAPHTPRTIIGNDARFVMHGGGGGQGGSYGGISYKIASESNSTFYYNYVNGIDGGNGTLDNPGGAGTSTVSFSTNDAKGGSPSNVTGGGVPGAALGQDALGNLNVVFNDTQYGTSLRFDGQPATALANSFVSPVIYSRGGNSIKGRSLITQLQGSPKGRQVG